MATTAREGNISRFFSLILASSNCQDASCLSSVSKSPTCSQAELSGGQRILYTHHKKKKMLAVQKAAHAELSALSGSHSKLQGRKLPNTFLLTPWEAWECLLTFERSSKQFSKLPGQVETVFYYLTESTDILAHFRQDTGHTTHEFRPVSQSAVR